MKGAKQGRVSICGAQISPGNQAPSMRGVRCWCLRIGRWRTVWDFGLVVWEKKGLGVSGIGGVEDAVVYEGGGDRDAAVLRE